MLSLVQSLGFLEALPLDANTLHVALPFCGSICKELLEWQLRVRSEQNWAVPAEHVGLRLAEVASYRDSSQRVSSEMLSDPQLGDPQ
eukprot:Skav204367  [mRNA]  locus=scaffold866:100425:105434:+ [translate_table: standard]